MECEGFVIVFAVFVLLWLYKKLKYVKIKNNIFCDIVARVPNGIKYNFIESMESITTLNLVPTVYCTCIIGRLVPS